MILPAKRLLYTVTRREGRKYKEQKKTEKERKSKQRKRNIREKGTGQKRQR